MSAFIRFHPSAFKHGYTKFDIIFAFTNAAPAKSTDGDIWMAIGPSATGEQLEIGFRISQNAFLIFHVMKARPKYRRNQ